MGTEPTTTHDRPSLFALLRRPRVGVALLLVYTFLQGVLGEHLHFSIDESFQWHAAQHSIGYILTHDPQNHPFYGVLVRLGMACLPGRTSVPLRLPAFVAGLLIPLLFYRANRRYAGHAPALLMALVLVMTDPLRFYSTVGRGYSLMLLGVLVLNHLVVLSLRHGGLGLALGYIPLGVATGMTHLWGFPIIGAHGLYLVMEIIWRRGKGVVARRALVMLAAVAATSLLGIAAISPMLAEIRSVAALRGQTLMLRPLLVALLQLPRFGSWTVAVHLLLVPILLEGFARRPLRLGRDRVARLYLMTIIVLLGWSAVMHSGYFGSRYILGLVPGAAGLAARGLTAYWRGPTTRRRLPVLPRPATWLIGLALGLLSANAPMAHEIPPGGQVNERGEDSGYYYRNLAKAIGDPLACGLLAAGVVGAVVGPWLGPKLPGWRWRPGVATAYFWTLVLLVSLVPVILGPAASRPLFEVHMVAVSAVLLDAWEHRTNARHLHALRFAFLLIALLAAAWQTNIALPQITPWTFLGLILSILPVLIIVPLVRTAAPPDLHRP